MRNYRAADDFGTIHENLERVLKRAWREEPATTPAHQNSRLKPRRRLRQAQSAATAHALTIVSVLAATNGIAAGWDAPS